ncbi:hypothetical protein PHMEG_00032924 [Phytophthora megakarya]|uniref:Reverse transcriptase domain-containing protein n=1 Tax=Phytophthora megakarya TaxID=4795 RepID=A0A225UU80_9STRA|nr:hypothetical protein PHMEG_00032924 [Phytophthora megakarya]
MEKSFHDMVHESLLIWIDDLLVFAESIDEYLRALEKLFTTMNIYGLKFSAMMTQLYRQTITWCGRPNYNNVSARPTGCETVWWIMQEQYNHFSKDLIPLLVETRKTKRVAAGIM